MKYMDMHCDTLYKHMMRDYKDNLYKCDKDSIDFDRMKKGNNICQFFAMFTTEGGDPIFKDYDFKRADSEVESMSDFLFKNIRENSDIISLAKNYEDILKNESENKMSAILTIEGGHMIDNSLEKIKKYYDLGVRLITLTWNFENSLGYPNSKNFDDNKKGLKKFGKEAIEYMKDLGIVVDVSHLSDGGFYDTADILKSPFVASHSNARNLTNHSRNLTDDMIKTLANNGGVSGINFASSFLNDRDDGYSSIDDIVKHLDYMKDKGGEDFVAIGTDFDGIESSLEIDSPDKIYLLEDSLLKAGWNYNQIEKLFYKNTLRVIKDIMK